MITEIGICAGEIWQYLDHNGSANLDQLAHSVNAPRELLLMSLGWLAREGHVTLGDAQSGFIVTLNRKSE